MIDSYRRAGLGLMVAMSLWLAGCASTATAPLAPPAASSAPAANSQPEASSDANAAPLAQTGSLKAKTNLGLLPPTDIWERIRRGFAMPDLEGPLVRDREQWYAAGPTTSCA